MQSATHNIPDGVRPHLEWQARHKSADTARVEIYRMLHNALLTAQVGPYGDNDGAERLFLAYVETTATLSSAPARPPHPDPEDPSVNAIAERRRTILASLPSSTGT